MRFAYEPREASAALRSSWERFVIDGVVEEGVRDVIADSWRRSIERSISFDLRAVESDERAVDGLATDFLEVAETVVLHLAGELAGSNSAIVACDPGGVIVSRGGDADILRRVGRLNFQPTGKWGESEGGTNGVGLALELGRTAFVFGSEHYCEAFQPYVCTASPVRHPITREVLGLIDISTDHTGMNVHTSALVANMAREFERLLEERIHGRERDLMERYLRGRATRRIPLMTVDRLGQTIIQNAEMLHTVSGDDLKIVLRTARAALERNEDLVGEIDLAIGRRLVSARPIRTDHELLGALVTVERVAVPRKSTAVAREPRVGEGWGPIVGRSGAIVSLFRDASLAAEHRVSTVIAGEPGTGKRLLAEVMHRRAGEAAGDLRVVSAARVGWAVALQEACTAGGTVLLERLQVLDEREQLQLAGSVDELGDNPRQPWIIAILSNDAAVLRLELLHRLAGTWLEVPPLREREDDIQRLISAWCARVAERGRVQPIVRADARELLGRRTWPGNVRELFNVLDAALRRRGSVIGATALDLPAVTPVAVGGDRGLTLRRLRDVEQQAILRALTLTSGNVSEAARRLGISRATLHRRLNAYRLLAGSARSPTRDR